jgi:periplasmic protein TonB
MRKLIILIIVLFPLFATAQADSTVQASEDEEIFDIVQEQPSYPGGDSAMKQFIAKNLVYPPLAIKDSLQGIVIVRFVVEPDGSVTKVKAVKSFDENCSREAVRIVQLMKWLPGKQRGKTVRVAVVLPIKFKLN